MSSSKKILVVDDDPDMLRLMSVKLKKNGYEVVVAGDGISCMSMVRKEHPDLIVLDLGLPAGDGFKTLERLKSLVPFSSIPVIVLTARDASEAKDRALSCGASAFFEKTASKDEVMGAVWRLLDESGSTEV